MGVEISTHARVLPRGRQGRLPERRAVWTDIRKAILGAIDDPLLARMVRCETRDEALVAHLHPAGCPLTFTWSPGGLVKAETKTSPAGPGYHAFVVDLLGTITQRTELNWQWTGPEGPADPSGYALTRDFVALQRHMAGLFRRQAQLLFRHRGPGCDHIQMNLPLGYPTVCDEPIVMTPVGPRPRQWFEAAGAADDTGLAGRCAEFFPWWHSTRDARFWLNCALTMAWVTLPWHPPISEEEFGLYELALACFKRVRELDPAVSLPETEMREIEEFVTVPPTEARAPRPEGIGYRRHAMIHHLTGPWTIELPGYFYKTTANDDEVLVFYYGERTVRFSSIAISGPEADSRAPGDLLPKNLPVEFRGAERIEVATEKTKGEGFFLQTRDRRGAYWVLQGGIAAPRTVGFFTICYRTDADRPWAVKTLKTISGPWNVHSDAETER